MLTTHDDMEIVKENLDVKENLLLRRIREIDVRYENLKNSVDNIIDDIKKICLENGFDLSGVLQDITEQNSNIFYSTNKNDNFDSNKINSQ